MQARLRIWLFVPFILLSCSSSSGFFGSKESSKSKSEEDGRRPSEQGEGLVGYLRDPNEVEFRREDGKITVEAPDGALIVDRGSPAGLIVCLQQISDRDLEDLLSSGIGFGGGFVTTLARAQANAAGGFRVTTDESSLATDKFLSINVTGQCGTDDAVSEFSPDANSIVFKDLNKDTPFGGAYYYYPGFANGQITSTDFETGSTASDDGGGGTAESPGPPPEEEKPARTFCGESQDECDKGYTITVVDDATDQLITSGLTMSVSLSKYCTGTGPEECNSEVYRYAFTNGGTQYFQSGYDFVLRFEVVDVYDSADFAFSSSDSPTIQVRLKRK